MKVRRSMDQTPAARDLHARRGLLRRMVLRGPGDVVFLDRYAVECRWFGVFLHRITAPDPGIDLHDHPWPFVSIVLRGGYTEDVADSRCPLSRRWRMWRTGSIHYMGLHRAHRIVSVESGTLTLVLRGYKSRPWGFFIPRPSGWVDQRFYDYEARRPVYEATA